MDILNGRKKKRNTGVMLSLLAIGAGAAALGIRGMRNGRNQHVEERVQNSPDNPDIFNYLQ